MSYLTLYTDHIITATINIIIIPSNTVDRAEFTSHWRPLISIFSLETTDCVRWGKQQHCDTDDHKMTGKTTI